MFQKIAIHLLHLLSKFEQNIPLKIFKNIKIYILLKMLKYKHFCDNDITNIVCSKPKKDGMCEKAIAKLLQHKQKIFQISPRAIVYCLVNKNTHMLQCLKKLGYPISIAQYADNFHLIQKKSRYHAQFISILHL